MKQEDINECQKAPRSWADVALPLPPASRRGVGERGSRSLSLNVEGGRRSSQRSEGGSPMLAVAGDVREPAGPASAQRQGGKLLGSKWGDLGSHFPQDLLWVTGHEATGSGCVA